VNDERRLSGVDLNLLVALDALLGTLSVTQAAKRVGLSQPAMSNALERLRALFGDPLLVRAGTGMVATARAQALRATLGHVLLQIRGMLVPEGPFNPSLPHHFRIAVTDYVGLTLLPKLAASVLGEYPSLSLEAVALENWQLPLSELDAGQLDLVVSFFRELPQKLSRELLFEEHFVCALRRDHPGVGKRLSLQKYTSLPHLMVSPRADLTGVVDVALAAYKTRRRIALTVPHFMSAPPILERTDCVATLPAQAARIGCSMAKLRLLAPPIALPGFSVSMVWHPELNQQPATEWLRQRVREAAASLRENVLRP
jgi:DNA-binding transcriptional LysR family regulator